MIKNDNLFRMVLFTYLEWFLNQILLRVINSTLGKGFSNEEAELMRINAIGFGDNFNLDNHKDIKNLLHNDIWDIIADLYGEENIYLPDYYVQIALRFPQLNDDLKYLPWHIDNVTREGIKGFGFIVGVFLNEVNQENGGNFTVFPGGHIVLQEHFKKHGTDTLYRSISGKIILPEILFAPQYQLQVKQGDIVICHHQLPHRAAPNISPNIRVAVFFRIYHKQLPFEHFAGCALRDAVLQNIWYMGWKGLHHLLDNDQTGIACDCETKLHAGKEHFLDFDQYIQGSYCDSNFEGWTARRKFICEAIDHEGTILDIGCANGFLLYCLRKWCSHKLVPYGIDSEPIDSVEDLFPIQYQHEHFQQVALEEFLVTEVTSFPKKFDFIYWNVWDNCSLEQEKHWIIKLLRYVKPSGRLILGFYDSSKSHEPKIAKVKELGLNFTTLKSSISDHTVICINGNLQ